MFDNHSGYLLAIQIDDKDVLNLPEFFDYNFSFKQGNLEIYFKDEDILGGEVPILFADIKYLLDTHKLKYQTQKLRANPIYDTLFLQHINGLM